MKFINPQNEYVENASSPLSWLWCLMFGPLYFLCRGNLIHAVLSFIAACLTYGISWFIYPLFVYSINNTHYLRKGWVPLQ